MKCTPAEKFGVIAAEQDMMLLEHSKNGKKHLLSKQTPLQLMLLEIFQEILLL